MEQVKTLLNELSVNPYGEKITVLGASKTRTAEEIIALFQAGVSVMGENRVQEFKEKYDTVHAAGIPYRFIGHLQTNKIKYLVGKVDLIESVDRTELLDAISAASVKAGVTTEILLQINGGKEESKSGYEVESVLSAADYALSLPNLKLRGLMAMLPADKNEQTLREICLQIREKYDIMRARYEGRAQAQIEILSMGMSEDYAIAVACGANEVRLGRILFGERK
ncbi:MAG: YggS family pyridoxal phosphate-dependent enzyme [Clostridia bacterium]|nr:YggS family pyridoxal phosphate-dependent enzyme [Clostridia bacterium]